eukprot:5203731-Prymnesium_polylepis.1
MSPNHPSRPATACHLHPPPPGRRAHPAACAHKRISCLSKPAPTENELWWPRPRQPDPSLENSTFEAARCTAQQANRGSAPETAGELVRACRGLAWTAASARVSSNERRASSARRTAAKHEA